MGRSLALRAVACTAAGALILAPGQAGAWGDQGHEIVAALALSYLNPAVKTKVLALLAKSDSVINTKDFVTRATWADKYRDQDRPGGPQYQGTHNWHFVNTPLSAGTSDASIKAAIKSQCPYPTLTTAASLGAPKNDCVVDKIRQFEAELGASTAVTPERVYALEFLMHFVGDVHQPLHSADNGDEGGNCVFVHGPGGQKVKLHAYWDTQVIQGLLNGATPTAYAATLKQQITPQQKAQWETDDPTQWAAEAFGQAKSVAYNLPGLYGCPKPGGHGPPSPTLDLPSGYDTAATNSGRVQLEKAGVRLAYVLNKYVK